MAHHQPSKALYHSEFSADRAATIRELQWGEEMMSYACGTHWHITHKDPALRGKHVKEFKSYCDVCKTALLPQNWMKHKTLAGHLAKEKSPGTRPGL